MLPVVTSGDPAHPRRLIFLHGGPGLDASYFLPHLEGLARSAELVFFTQGASGKKNLDGFLSEIDEVLAARPGASNFFFAHSFGGSLALEYLNRRGTAALSGLVLCSWVHDRKHLDGTRHPDAPAAPYRDDAEFRAAVVNAAPLYFTAPFVARGREILSRLSYDLALFREIETSFYRAFDGAGVLRSLDVPVLSLTGTEDRVVPPAHVRRGCAFNAAIASREIPEAGHFPFVENPDRVVRETRTFLERVRPAFAIRSALPPDNAALARIIRSVMTEHGAVGEGFSIMDPEVDAIAETYAAPGWRYRVIEIAGQVAGGGGVGPLAGGPEGTCELRKMYLLPEARGLGAGRTLLNTCLTDARELGYRRCYLETLGTMKTARVLYERTGFVKIPVPLGKTGHHGCDAWYAMDLA